MYIYHCYRGAHMSAVAAALHLGRLQADAAVADILNLEYFDTLQAQDAGVPVLAGYDSNGAPVYFIGLGRGGRVFSRLLDSVAGELGIKLDYKAVNCLTAIHWATRLGGFLSTFPRWRRWGRLLAAWGVRRKLPQIVALVLQAKGN